MAASCTIGGIISGAVGGLIGGFTTGAFGVKGSLGKVFGALTAGGIGASSGSLSGLLAEFFLPQGLPNRLSKGGGSDCEC